MRTPLLVIIVRVGSRSDSDPYAAALRDAFMGARSGGGVAPKELLQAAELREFAIDPAAFTPLKPMLPRALLQSAERVLIIALDSRALPPPVTGSLNDTETALLQALGPDTGSQHIVHAVLQAPDSLFDSQLPDARVVRLGLADLGERDLRLPFLTLYALHNALRLFAQAATGGAGAPTLTRLFFSHAKRDGVLLTTAVLDWMKRLKGFDAFYDTVNLDLDGDLDKQLGDAVASAVVIVFRTDIFDQRYWCQKEVIWAEQHGCPVITVDARWQIEHSPSVISFDSTPVIRIPDGSVVRIFSTALVEALRIELFRARAAMHGATLTATQVQVIPRWPSLVSLHVACDALRSSGGRSFVVYPNPSLPAPMVLAAEGLAAGVAPNCRVKSLDEFRLVV